MFTLVLDRPQEGRESRFLASVGLHGLVLLLAVWVGTNVAPRIASRISNSTLLVAPVSPSSRPARLRRPEGLATKTLIPTVTPRLFVPPMLPTAPSPKEHFDAPVILAEARPAPPIAQPTMPLVSVPAPVRTGNLEAVTVPQVAAKQSSAPLVGGFGAPETGRSVIQSAPPQVGVFGLPGPASQKPSTRSVIVAGLDNQAPVKPVASARTLRSASFGASDVAPAQVARRQLSAVRNRQVEILYKPKPQYTDEARARQIEGEVVLDVLFSRAGDVRVLRVVRGLGLGLDQSAARAAQGIRFRPAEEDGVPVDAAAMIRIQFLLAF